MFNPISVVIFGLFLTGTSGLISEVGRANIIEQADADTPEAEEAIVDEFEKKLLNVFGLSRRPNPTGNMPVPRIMQHLYKAHMGDDYDGPHSLDSSWEPGFDLPHESIASRVNTARSFHHIDTEERPDGISDNHIRLLFNISSLPDREELKFSELLLHREEIQQHMDSDMNDCLHRINLYEVIKMSDDDTENSMTSHDDVSSEQAKLIQMVNSRRSKFGLNQRTRRPITRLLETRVVDTRNTTWERFDVSAVTMKWLKVPNHGLIVEIVREDNGESPNPDADKHVRLRRDTHDKLDDYEWHHMRPTLLMYSDDGKYTSFARRSRKKRKANRRQRKKNNLKPKENNNCKRKPLYVDFGDVDWNTWIVAPHGYHAYYCEGDCPFPLADYMNATNHAIVQTLVHAVDKTMAPMPCCVPTELSAIAMLYLDELELVVLKTYQEMTVEACGCR